MFSSIIILSSNRLEPDERLHLVASPQDLTVCNFSTVEKFILSNQLQFRLVSSKVSKGATIRNRYNQVPHLTQDTNWKVRAKRSALSQQVTTRHV